MKTIRAKAVCLFRRNGKILLAKGYDPTKDETYLIPVGGGIEFGETAKNAAIRETFEEINAKIYRIKLLGISENIFIFDGKEGHEIVFVYEADFVDETLYNVQEICGVESSGTQFFVQWFDEASVKNGTMAVYPDGMIDML